MDSASKTLHSIPRPYLFPCGRGIIHQAGKTQPPHPVDVVFVFHCVYLESRDLISFLQQRTSPMPGEMTGVELLTPVVLRSPQPFAAFQSCNTIDIFPQIQTRLSIHVRATNMGSSGPRIPAIIPCCFHLAALKMAQGE